MVKKLWYANPRNKYPFRNDSVKMSKGVFEKNAHGSNFGSPLCSIIHLTKTIMPHFRTTVKITSRKTHYFSMKGLFVK
jgi:hypothetical protein